MKHLSHENKRTFGKCSKQIDELLEGFTPETREAVLRGLVDKSKLPEGWKSKGTEDVCIFNNNRRGFNSKKQSVQEDIVDKLQPDVINLEETLLRNKAKINTKEYVSFSQNRADGAGGGGISTSVAAHLKQYATLVSQNNQHDEYMITRLEHVKPALNIVHIYGQNEGRSGPEKVLKGWTEILKELSSIEERNEVALLVGDMNRAIGNDELGVRGNSRKVSYGGQLVRDLVSTGGYILLNNLELTRPWALDMDLPGDWKGELSGPSPGLPCPAALYKRGCGGQREKVCPEEGSHQREEPWTPLWRPFSSCHKARNAKSRNYT